MLNILFLEIIRCHLVIHNWWLQCKLLHVMQIICCSFMQCALLRHLWITLAIIFVDTENRLSENDWYAKGYKKGVSIRKVMILLMSKMLTKSSVQTILTTVLSKDHFFNVLKSQTIFSYKISVFDDKVRWLYKILRKNFFNKNLQ